MKELTYKQHLILVNMETESSHSLKNNDSEIETYWELTREGYLKHSIILIGYGDWSFKLTKKAEKYLEPVVED